MCVCGGQGVASGVKVHCGLQGAAYPPGRRGRVIHPESGLENRTIVP